MRQFYSKRLLPCNLRFVSLEFARHRERERQTEKMSEELNNPMARMALNNRDVDEAVRPSSRRTGSPRMPRRTSSPRLVNSPHQRSGSPRHPKQLKESQNLSHKSSRGRKKQVRFGISFDVDGVLARGTLALPMAKDAIDLLKDQAGEVRVPITFVTNALNRDVDKANQISGWLDIPVSPEQMIQAQGPLEIFHKMHNKHCLVIGQGKIFDIAKELGFKNICTVEQVADAYPLLDMVDHDNRRRVAREGYTEKDFPRIEAIVMMGEPKHWESSLQLIVDILKTNGKPDKAPEAVPETHLPVIACNMDLQFMDRACMPRYGHGAFLCCLEALYKKVTGYDLKYHALIGKPSEITFRYAEHCLAREARKLGIDEQLKRLYLIGDTPEVDIVGANLYQRYISRIRQRRINNDGSTKDPDLIDPELPDSRNIPAGANFSKQSIEEALPVLVCTGVYKQGQEQTLEGDEKNYHGHRDFPYNPNLAKPHKICENVHEAIKYILEREQIDFSS